MFENIIIEINFIFSQMHQNQNLTSITIIRKFIKLILINLNKKLIKFALKCILLTIHIYSPC